MIWDELRAIDPYSPENCGQPEAIQRALSQNVQQRFTLSEMEAIYNAFKVFEGAHQHLGMGSIYQWPLGNPVSVEKREYVGESAADLSALGKHNYEMRRITMSARNWGEFEDTAYRVNAQIRAWLVLHEFSHIFVKDRTPPGFGAEYYATDPAGGLPALIIARFGRVIPTGYASFSDQERAIEVVTATLWNNGYSTVGFSSGAGGRTAPIGGTAQDSYNGQTFNLTNVRDIVVQGETLEQWIIANVILRNP